MAITRTPIIDDSGSGQDGTVIDNAWKQEFYNQIDAVVGGASAGAWVDIPYSAGIYTASAGTWTVTAGQQLVLAYTVVNKIAFFQMAIDGSTNSAAASRLFITLPGSVPGTTKNGLCAALVYYCGGSNAGTGYVENLGVSPVPLLRDILGTPWPGSTLYLRAQWFYPIA